MRLPKEVISRRVDILIQNVPTISIKVTSCDDVEVIGTYQDGEEWHINATYIMAWTYSIRTGMSDESKAKRKRTMSSRTTPEASKSNDKGSGGIIV